MTTSADKTDDGVPAGIKEKPVPKKLYRAGRTEPVMAFFCLAYYMPSTFVQNLMMDKVCDGLYDRDHCRDVSNLSHVEEDHVQKVASQQLLYYNLMQNIPSLLITFLLGHWSDLHGRKVALFMPVMGIIAANFTYSLVYLNDAWPANSITWAGLPAGLTGGFPVFMMSFFGWLRDIHSLKELALHIAINDGIENICIQFASLIGGQLYEHFGYLAVFGTSAGCAVVAAVLIVTNVKDDRYPAVGWSIMVRDLFRIQSVLENFKLLARKRKNRKRCYLLLMLVVIIVGYFNIGGVDEITFLYTRLRVHWNAVTYSYYMVAQAAFMALGYLIVLPVATKILKLSDMTVALLGHFGAIGLYLTTAFALTTPIMFASSSFMLFGALRYITFRAVTTKCISNDEAGKLMAICAIIQTVGNNIGRVVTTRIYIATLATSSPYTCYLVITACCCISIFIFCWMTFDMKRHNVNLDIEEEEEEEKEEPNSSSGVSELKDGAVRKRQSSFTVGI